MVHNHRRGRKEPELLDERIDSGPCAIRALDERLGLNRLIGEHSSDSPQGFNRRLTLGTIPAGKSSIFKTTGKE